MSEHLATCPHCEVARGLRIKVEDGNIVGVRGDAEHPGANLNVLTGPGGIDLPSGTAAFNGVDVRVRALGTTALVRVDSMTTFADMSSMITGR
ncbi:hypothetical protein OIE68_01240 [Nocardia vinacea]|uniref:4Fe-4S Mo/W bis-MGD-type domain-containing protein n=1 Tax=Nocardia vinacea TaxID=96468 RepID=A0ABZ1YLS2_9NOCA|nr:hypothetical protein OIE68_01240 [Nocardia vinacea]